MGSWIAAPASGPTNTPPKSKRSKYEGSFDLPDIEVTEQTPVSFLLTAMSALLPTLSLFNDYIWRLIGASIGLGGGAAVGDRRGSGGDRDRGDSPHAR